MAESNQQPRQKGQVIDDAVSVFVNKKIFDGWKSASVTFNLQSIAQKFRLDYFDRYGVTGEQRAIKPGDLAHIHIADESVFTGYVDSLNSSFDAGQRTTSISGRSKTADLVDCSPLGKKDVSGLKLDKLIENFISDFGLRVVSGVSDLGEAFEQFSPKPNETVYDTIKRAASMRGFLLISDENSNVIITRKGSVVSSTGLEQGKNIISASASFNNSNRFSEYVVKSQTAGTDNFFGKQASEAQGRAEDKGILRYRPTVVVAETGAGGKTAQTRAEWEATLRAAEALTVDCTVQGWRKADGSLWKVNEIVPFRSRFLGIDSNLLVSSLTFSRDLTNGTTTRFQLIRPDAFEVKKVIPEQDDPLSFL